MKNNIRVLSLITAALIAASMTGCGGTGEQATATDSTAVPESTSAETYAQTTAAESTNEAASETEVSTGTHKVIDHAGREVEVPDNVTKVVIDQIPILSTYTAYFDGEAPYLVGFCGSFKDTISKTVLGDIAPELMTTADTVYAQSDLNAVIVDEVQYRNRNIRSIIPVEIIHNAG